MNCQAMRFESQYFSACWCKQCEQVKLRCHNVVLPLRATQLQSFVAFLADLHERKVVQQQREEVDFKFGEVYLVFSGDELLDIVDMMERVGLEMKRSELESLFSKSCKEGTTP